MCDIFYSHHNSWHGCLFCPLPAPNPTTQERAHSIFPVETRPLIQGCGFPFSSILLSSFQKGSHSFHFSKNITLILICFGFIFIFIDLFNYFYRWSMGKRFCRINSMIYWMKMLSNSLGSDLANESRRLIMGKYKTCYDISWENCEENWNQLAHQYICFFCGKTKMKRWGMGIWHCGSCMKTVAAGA